MKYLQQLKVTENKRLNERCNLLKLSTDAPEILNQCQPGQFIQARISGCTVYLRRPVSVHFVDYESKEIWLLVQEAGKGTHSLCHTPEGDYLEALLPLGKGFSVPQRSAEQKILLIGGGVGVAPLLFLASLLNKRGFLPSVLLGARIAGDLLQEKEFAKFAQVYTSTEDGSRGEQGFITSNSILNQADYTHIYACGPLPMMKAVASYAQERNIFCEVSLENTMACGLGACLCCVENTRSRGNVCTCTEGPVFNINDLLWNN